MQFEMIENLKDKFGKQFAKMGASCNEREIQSGKNMF